ncbi:hypothetical protein LJ739_15070 [Aestuariibacter halophilus]|uniref:Uncharacterized protein n=1 Tax=Fluctibacter halophilus TaxID=226011 RepID=A0ABS8GAM7_9ALTE|nr:hypothetical protein [Aestuariibacter halophilus]MCC2617573.1 hypothetical protein [Aestuariibacter halophilus]
MYAVLLVDPVARRRQQVALALRSIAGMEVQESARFPTTPPPHWVVCAWPAPTTSAPDVHVVFYSTTPSPLGCNDCLHFDALNPSPFCASLLGLLKRQPGIP